VCCFVLQGAASASGSVEDTLRQELNSQREVSARLRQDLAAARQQLHDLTAQCDEQQSSLQEHLQQRETELQRVQLELQQRPTAARVAELQQQIRVLQAVGYGSLPAEDLGGSGPLRTGASGTLCGPGLEGSMSLGSDSVRASESGVAANGSQGGAGGLNLEGLLLAKNRKLEHEVTVARLALAEANQQLEATREQVRGRTLRCAGLSVV
jgi:homeobox protein cut-like